PTMEGQMPFSAHVCVDEGIHRCVDRHSAFLVCGVPLAFVQHQQDLLQGCYTTVEEACHTDLKTIAKGMAPFIGTGEGIAERVRHACMATIACHNNDKGGCIAMCAATAFDALEATVNAFADAACILSIPLGGEGCVFEVAKVGTLLKHNILP